MEFLAHPLIFLAALGSGVMTGLYFAFSAFIMTAFGRLPAAGGIAAMNAINVAILNPLFFAVFFGTAAVSVVLAIVALTGWLAPGVAWLLGQYRRDHDLQCAAQQCARFSRPCECRWRRRVDTLPVRVDGLEPRAHRRLSRRNGLLHSGAALIDIVRP
jgi:hypothetical protein